MKDDQFFNLAHDVRNPLAAIQGFAALLYKDLEGDAHKQKMLKHIEESAKKIENVLSSAERDLKR